MNIKITREELRIIKKSLKLYYDIEHLDFESLSEHPSIKSKIQEKISGIRMFNTYRGLRTFLKPISKTLQLVITGDESFEVKKDENCESFKLFNKL